MLSDNTGYDTVPVPTVHRLQKIKLIPGKSLSGCCSDESRLKSVVYRYIQYINESEIGYEYRYQDKPTGTNVQHNLVYLPVRCRDKLQLELIHLHLILITRDHVDVIY